MKTEIIEASAPAGLTSSAAPAAPRADRSDALAYMPQLDGLRTIAVAAVMAQHYGVFAGGAGFGVHLFFVLSGFLITGILLAERDNVDELGITRLRAFKQFYVRRALRILPLYYFVVLVALLLNAGRAREFTPWLLTYTYNLNAAGQLSATFAHFWSLAIEEQYYLVWPWLILLLPRKWLVRAAIFTIASALLYRFVIATWPQVVGYHNAPILIYIGTPSALDSLGMGSLLAILSHTQTIAPQLKRAMRFAIPAISLSALIAIQLGPRGTFHVVFADTIAAVLFAWLIYTASHGFSGIIGAFLSAAPIVYLGRISYGIYVYHPLVAAMAAKTAQRFGITIPENAWSSALLYSLLTIAVASVSWYAMERPLNELKRRFPYLSRSTAA